MAELRFNPLLRTYTMVASNRQNRPHLPADWCPFCPSGSGKVPDDYEVFAYENDFPVLSLLPDEVAFGSPLYEAAPAYGKCEVILYSPDHRASLGGLAVEKIVKIVELWQQRFIALAKDERIKFIFLFENRGEEVGVTIHHPHGQLYGYPFVPLKLKTELDSCKAYFMEKGTSLLDDMNREELRVGSRMVAENDSFLAYIPYFTDYPYGVFIVTKNGKPNIAAFNEKEIKDLASMLKLVTSGFDSLFNRPFPYMMCVNQTPVNSPEYADADQYFRFHIEFYPPLRDKDRIKWYASSEMGAWAAANTLSVEECANQLRNQLTIDN